MPNTYIRTSTRAQWSAETLKEAATRIQAGEIGKREAERYYGIPARLLSRRMALGDFTKKGLGPVGVLGASNEKRLVSHIQKLAAAGFAPDRVAVRVLAFKFAEKLGIQHNFSRNAEMAGTVWFNSFLKRNPELSVRQAQGLSVNRAQGMNRVEVGNFFKLLENVLEENDLVNKPGHIFNIDETGFPLINKPKKVVASRGAKSVHTVTPKERGENITLVGCCNAEGTFIPPVLIMKGVNKRAEFVDGLPAGSDVYMNSKSSYINCDLFMKWFKEQFVPRKPSGKTLLILDGHSSHVNALELLEYAAAKDGIILCLPSHTAQAIQPLDRSFFGPLKTYYNKEAETWIRCHKDRNITRFIGKAWNKAASVGNAVSGFRATGIFPLNPDVIPDHFFSISDAAHTFTTISTTPQPQMSVSLSSREDNLSNIEDDVAHSSKHHLTSSWNMSPKSVSSTLPSTTTETPSTSKETPSSKETPTKYLHEDSPIPVVPQSVKRFKQTAEILNTALRIQNLKSTKQLKAKSNGCKRRILKESTHEQKTNKTLSSNSATSTENIKDDTNNCVECWENYFRTTSKTDWIQCAQCHKWLHETCTLYGELCVSCGRENVRRKHAGKQK